MYKFTNGVVCYDEKTKDKYIKSGMILIKEKPIKKEENYAKSEIDSEVKSDKFEQIRKRTSKIGRSLK